MRPILAFAIAMALFGCGKPETPTMLESQPMAMDTADGSTLRMLGAGVDTSKPLQTTFELYFDSEEEAKEARDEVAKLDLAKEREFKMALKEADGNWLVSAQATMLLTEERLTAIRERLEEIAGRHGGQYDGWFVTKPLGP